MSIETTIKAIRSHAELPENYNSGWDVLVECWDDDYIADMFAEDASPEDAIAEIGETIADLFDQETDMLLEVF